jgi:hypothetical protein
MTLHFQNFEPAISAYCGAVFITFLFFYLAPNLFAGKLAQAFKSLIQLAAAVTVGFLIATVLAYGADLTLSVEPGRLFKIYPYSLGISMLWFHSSFIKKLASPQNANLTVCGVTVVLFLLFAQLN